MLGSLSRWLRLFGFDTLYRNNFKDQELIKISIQNDRILLTRDNVLAKSKPLKKVLLIRSEDIKDQIKEVVEKILRDNPSFSVADLLNFTPRCPVCNGDMEKIRKEKVKEDLPEHVVFSTEEFVICKFCGKIYWHGTHKERIDKIKKEILENN